MDGKKSGTERAKYWQAKYRNYEESGQTQSGYCKSEGISLWSFKAGIQEARREGLIAASGRPGRKRSLEASFVPIRVLAVEDPSEPYCEIRFNGKPGIRIERRESIGLMRELITGLSA